MSILDSLLTNFSSPIILCFILGLVARLLKSDLELPDQLYTSISIYLLLAIGLKGGIQLSESTLSEVSGPLAGCLLGHFADGILSDQVIGKFSADSGNIQKFKKLIYKY